MWELEETDDYGRKTNMHAGQANRFAYSNIYTAIKAHKVIKIGCT